MRLLLTSMLAVGVLATPLFAATITLKTELTLGSPTGTVSDGTLETFDTTIDGQLQFQSETLMHPTQDVDGLSAAGVDLSLNAARARTKIEKAPASGETRAIANTRSSVRSTYHVQGDGRAYVALTVYGDFKAETDLQISDRLMNAFGAITAVRGSDSFIDSFSVSSDADPLFDGSDGSFNRKLMFDFGVADGDVFTLNSVIGSSIFLSDFVTAGLLLELDVKSGLRVYGADGATVTPNDIPAVPLPASALLLLSGLGGVVALGRRRRA